MKTIIGVKLENRRETAAEFQAVITDFGCGIRTRIGLHDTFGDNCVNYGIVLLEVVDNTVDTLFAELSKKWVCQKMVF